MRGRWLRACAPRWGGDSRFLGLDAPGAVGGAGGGDGACAPARRTPAKGGQSSGDQTAARADVRTSEGGWSPGDQAQSWSAAVHFPPKTSPTTARSMRTRSGAVSAHRRNLPPSPQHGPGCALDEARPDTDQYASARVQAARSAATRPWTQFSHKMLPAWPWAVGARGGLRTAWYSRGELAHWREWGGHLDRAVACAPAMWPTQIGPSDGRAPRPILHQNALARLSPGQSCTRASDGGLRIGEEQVSGSQSAVTCRARSPTETPRRGPGR